MTQQKFIPKAGSASGLTLTDNNNNNNKQTNNNMYICTCIKKISSIWCDSASPSAFSEEVLQWCLYFFHLFHDLCRRYELLPEIKDCWKRNLHICYGFHIKFFSLREQCVTRQISHVNSIHLRVQSLYCHENFCQWLAKKFLSVSKGYLVVIFRGWNLRFLQPENSMYLSHWNFAIFRYGGGKRVSCWRTKHSWYNCDSQSSWKQIEKYILKIKACFSGKPDQPSKVVQESWFKPIKICKRGLEVIIALVNPYNLFHWNITELTVPKHILVPQMWNGRDTEIVWNIPGNISALTCSSQDKSWCCFKRFGSGCNREMFINRHIRVRWPDCLVFWKRLSIVKYQTMQVVTSSCLAHEYMTTQNITSNCGSRDEAK